MTEVYFWVGLVLANLLLASLWFVTGLYGHAVFKRMMRVYHLTVIWYWLDRLEKEGTHVFEKARKEPNDE